MTTRIPQREQPCRPPPLTHRNRDGQLYQRLPSIERRIEEALALEPDRLVARARIRDREADGYLHEEALVCLIRVYHRHAADRLVEDLVDVLIQRITGSIRARLCALGPDLLEQAYEDVVVELFDQILDLASDRGDYFQVRFGLALKRVSIDVFRRYARQRNSEQSLAPPVEAGDEASTSQEPEAPEPAISTDERLLLQAALGRLEEPYRTAFVLRYYEDWPVEDRDPSVPTISRHFGKTSRTIRNWLAHAHRVLRDWQEAEA